MAVPTVAAIPAAPPPPRTPITEAEALCYNLRHSVMCGAILTRPRFLNIFLAMCFGGCSSSDWSVPSTWFAAQGTHPARRPDLGSRRRGLAARPSWRSVILWFFFESRCWVA